MTSTPAYSHEGGDKSDYTYSDHVADQYTERTQDSESDYSVSTGPPTPTERPTFIEGVASLLGSVDEAFSKFALGAIRAEASTRPEKRVGPARGSRGRQHFQVAWEETEALRKALEAQLVRAISPNQALVPPATAQLGAPIQGLCHIQPPG